MSSPALTPVPGLTAKQTAGMRTMLHFNFILQDAFDLLARGSELGGLTLDLAFSTEKVNVNVQRCDGQLAVRLDRVVGSFSLQGSVPDDTVECLGAFTAVNAEQAVEEICDKFTEIAFGSATVTIIRLLYRQENFAQTELTLIPPAPRVLGYAWHKRSLRVDNSLYTFVAKVVNDALRWHRPFSAEQICLRFKPNQQIMDIDCSIKINDDFSFEVSVREQGEDQLRERLLTPEKVQSAIAGYLSERHSFQFAGMTVHFSHIQWRR